MRKPPHPETVGPAARSRRLVTDIPEASTNPLDRYGATEHIPIIRNNGHAIPTDCAVSAPIDPPFRITAPMPIYGK